MVNPQFYPSDVAYVRSKEQSVAMRLKEKQRAESRAQIADKIKAANLYLPANVSACGEVEFL